MGGGGGGVVGGLTYLKHVLDGGLIETGASGEYLRGSGLFNLGIKKMVSVLHKELACNVKKLKHKKLEVMQPGHATEDQKQIRTSSW